MNKGALGLIAIVFFLAASFFSYYPKTSNPLPLFDSSRYYYYSEKFIDSGSYRFYDDLSYSGRFNASPPLQEFIIFLLYKFFNFGLSVYDFLKYYSFIIFSASSILLYSYLFKKKGLLAGVLGCFLFIFNAKIISSFESGVIKHFQLGLLLFILGLLLVESYSKKKWLILAYSIILPLSYLESVVIFLMLISYMIIFEKKNKRYLIMGFALGCIYWLVMLIFSESAVLTSEFIYEKLGENKPLSLESVYAIMGYSLILLIFLIPKFIKRQGFEEIFFIIILAGYSFARVKDLTFFITLLVILMSFTAHYLSRKNFAFTIVILVILLTPYFQNYLSYKDAVTWVRPSAALIDAYHWIRNNTGNDSVVFECINHGSEVLAYAIRKNTGDNFFEFINDLPLNASIDYIDFISSYNYSVPEQIIKNYGADYFVFHKSMNDPCYWWINPLDKILMPYYFENMTSAPFIYQLYKNNSTFLESVYENDESVIFRVIQ